MEEPLKHKATDKPVEPTPPKEHPAPVEAPVRVTRQG